MIETIDTLLRTPQVRRYRAFLLILAGTLLSLHVCAIVLPFVVGPESSWIQPLIENSGNLLGVTGALVVLVILDRAIVALTHSERRGQKQVYEFIGARVKEWFAQSNRPHLKSFLEKVVDDESYTDFKVEGYSKLVNGVSPEIAAEFCRRVHFEFSFYPTKVVYGIHFESPSADVNEAMLENVRKALAIDDDTGFVRDKMIPKKPSWIFLIRTVDIPGGLEKELPTIMTHARHFVELIGHSYDSIYCEDMAAKFAAVSA